MPGEIICVDQMESKVLGFIAQMKRWLTKKRYKFATMFVDKCSRFTYVHLQTTSSGEQTVRAKRAFESYAERFGIKVKRYHADNGRFVEIEFMSSIQANKQEITLCGVNAHFQNGIAERMIRHLQE
jgi:hypothetical protein